MTDRGKKILPELYKFLKDIKDFKEEWNDSLQQLISENYTQFFKDMYLIIQNAALLGIEDQDKYLNQFQDKQYQEQTKQLQFQLNEQDLNHLLKNFCQIEFLKQHTNDITNRLDNISISYYCNKDQTLQESYHQENISESKKIQKQQYIEKINKAQEEMRRTLIEIKQKTEHHLKQWIESLEYTIQKSEYQAINENKTDPILPNIFLNVNITGTLIKMLGIGYFDEEQQEKKYVPQEIADLEQNNMIEDRYILPHLKGQKLFDYNYEPYSVISNSRASQNLIIQQLLRHNENDKAHIANLQDFCCKRKCVSHYTVISEPKEQSKEYSGDIIGFMNSSNKNKKYILLASSGLEQYSAELSDHQENSKLGQLNFKVKNYALGDSKYISQCQDTDQISQLEFAFHQIKKALVTWYLIQSSTLSFIVIRDSESDFSLVQQIKLLCSGYIKFGKKESFKKIYIIHYYPELEEQYEKDQIHLRIQSRFKLEDEGNGFADDSIIQFQQKVDPVQNGYRDIIDPNRFIFKHILLFGDINNSYNQRIMEILKDQITSIESQKIAVRNLEYNFSDFLSENMKLFVRKEQDHLEFNTQNNKNKNNNNMYKDLLAYPFNLFS